MPYIGLTGNLGNGKSTVLKLFRDAGAYTINADRIVHELLGKPPIIKKLVSLLGQSILTDTAARKKISKQRIAEEIFNDPVKRASVERIIHPAVIKKADSIRKCIAEINKNAVIIFEVPLLYEGGYEDIFDRVIVVHCGRAAAAGRLARQGMSKEQIRKRYAAQLPLREKKQRADFLVNNNGPLSETKTQVRRLFNKLVSLQ